jgi:hypothetical protein
LKVRAAASLCSPVIGDAQERGPSRSGRCDPSSQFHLSLWISAAERFAVA